MIWVQLCMQLQQHLSPLGMRNEVVVPSIGRPITEIWPRLVAFACPFVLTHVSKRWFLAKVRQGFSFLKPHFRVQNSPHVLYVQIVTASYDASII